MTEAMYDTAARWQLRLESGPLGPGDESALSAWLAADPRHRIALAEAGMAWHGSAQAHPDAVHVAPAAHRAPQRPWAAWLAGAAGAPLLLLAIAFAPAWWATLGADARSAVGAQATLRLPDGSRAVLDSDSAIAYDFDGAARELRVLRGAAWFEVVPDATRPFRVHAGATTATAVGTAYAVDRRGDTVEVIVTHGLVEVAQGAAPPVRVAAGQRSLGAAPAIALDARATAAAGWREGLLSFQSEPLADALARLDRYLPQRVVLLDAARGGEPVSAVFPLADAALAVDAIARSHGLAVRRLPGLLLVGDLR